MVAFIITSPGTTGTDTPPGMTAFNLRPPRTPPQISKRSLNGMPSGNSMFCGLFTWPEIEKIIVPAEFATPRSTNHFAPLRRIVGTEAKLCVLLIVVGLPYKPKFAGNGGLNRGRPCLPSSDSSNAVSSPQMYAPAPTYEYRSKSTPEPSRFLPSKP